MINNLDNLSRLFRAFNHVDVVIPRGEGVTTGGTLRTMSRRNYPVWRNDGTSTVVTASSHVDQKLELVTASFYATDDFTSIQTRKDIWGGFWSWRGCENLFEELKKIFYTYFYAFMHLTSGQGANQTQ